MYTDRCIGAVRRSRHDGRMLYLVIGLVEALCVVATLAPLRSGAVCTPATHRARAALGMVCALLCAVGLGRFVWFVVVQGHGIGFHVVVGQLVAASFALQALVLLRGLSLRPARALPLALLCAGLGTAAFIQLLERGP